MGQLSTQTCKLINYSNFLPTDFSREYCKEIHFLISEFSLCVLGGGGIGDWVGWGDMLGKAADACVNACVYVCVCMSALIRDTASRGGR